MRCKCSKVSASTLLRERQIGSTYRRRDSESKEAKRSGDKSVDAKLKVLLQLLLLRFSVVITSESLASKDQHWIAEVVVVVVGVVIIIKSAMQWDVRQG